MSSEAAEQGSQSTQVKDIKTRVCRDPRSTTDRPLDPASSSSSFSNLILIQPVWGRMGEAEPPQARRGSGVLMVCVASENVQGIARCRVQNIPLRGPEWVPESPGSLVCRKINPEPLSVPDHKLHLIWSSSFCLSVSSHPSLAPTCRCGVQDRPHY